MTTGNEWADNDWASAGATDRWKLSDNVGKLVRLRMTEQRTLPSPTGDWQAIVTAVDVVNDDGTGYETFTDQALGNAWLVSTFGPHLPYVAVGVVDSYPTAKGQGYSLRKATDDERAKLDAAVDDPGF